jgi:phosphatidylserine/phosphatidylglycerophosphate/cardiolipin synthase-like enzyme
MKFSKTIFIAVVMGLLFQSCRPQDPNVLVPTVPLPTPTVIETPTLTPTRVPPFELAPLQMRAGYGYRASWMEVYFTNPNSPDAASGSGGIDGPLSAAIVAARQSVDVAMTSLGLNTIVQALIRAHSRGVPVRVVMETDNVEARNPQELRDAGIPLVEDRRDGTMHNTFLVIDGKEVWTGSMEYTTSGVFREHNNVVRIFSEEIAANYTREFEEMFLNDQFGIHAVPDTPNPRVTIQDIEIETYFSPDDITVTRLAQLLGEAQESIYFMAYSFTSEDIGTVMRRMSQQGVTVTGVLESSPLNLESTSQYSALRDAGIDVRLGNPSRLINHKVIIIDNSIVVLGSYDFTNRAEKENDENLLIIHSELVAERFMEEFQRIQESAMPE